jgi:hypothetical protein
VPLGWIPGGVEGVRIRADDASQPRTTGHRQLDVVRPGNWKRRAYR